MGLVGNPGQANYAAASTVQDTFARWRALQKETTRPIYIGPIEGAGYLHGKPEHLDNLRMSKLEPIPLNHFLSTLTYVISNLIDVAASHLALGSFLPTTPDESSVPLDDPFVKHLLIPKESLPVATSTDAVVAPEALISEAPRVDRPTQKVAAIIQLAISHKVSQIMGVPLQDIDPLQSIMNLSNINRTSSDLYSFRCGILTVRLDAQLP
ncbi:hypothetical protein BDV40DRAFT_294864 [Aspergillus tamarii]|uniref:Ketoreductase (KR) domain-containing protein n=1 Tax=Aspergillus tamarii TaxID=41984 RepID=A0A5N6VEY7_ASPTM|nr:hypothetical protein BDV40DRAFT_294864 [Aspergillus tamarii]